jgi:hypothetical protein
MSGRPMTTWRALLETERALNGDVGPIVHVAPEEAVLDVQFDAGYGSEQGPPVLVWSEQYVYFPVCYDGSEWLGSAPRNPDPEGQEHVGGG